MSIVSHLCKLCRISNDLCRNRWIKLQDGVRVDLTNTDTRNTQKTTFINNPATSQIGSETVPEKQSLAKALRPKADN